VEGTKTEADKCELHPKIIQWPQAWTFPIIILKKTVEFTCLGGGETEALISWKTIKYKAQEPAKPHITWHHFKANMG